MGVETSCHAEGFVQTCKNGERGEVKDWDGIDVQHISEDSVPNVHNVLDLHGAVSPGNPRLFGQKNGISTVYDPSEATSPKATEDSTSPLAYCTTPSKDPFSVDSSADAATGIANDDLEEAKYFFHPEDFKLEVATYMQEDGGKDKQKRKRRRGGRSRAERMAEAEDLDGDDEEPESSSDEGNDLPWGHDVRKASSRETSPRQADSPTAKGRDAGHTGSTSGQSRPSLPSASPQDDWDPNTPVASALAPVVPVNHLGDPWVAFAAEPQTAMHIGANMEANPSKAIGEQMYDAPDQKRDENAYVGKEARTSSIAQLEAEDGFSDFHAAPPAVAQPEGLSSEPAIANTAGAPKRGGSGGSFIEFVDAADGQRSPTSSILELPEADAEIEDIASISLWGAEAQGGQPSAIRGAPGAADLGNLLDMDAQPLERKAGQEELLIDLSATAGNQQPSKAAAPLGVGEDLLCDLAVIPDSKAADAKMLNTEPGVVLVPVPAVAG